MFDLKNALFLLLITAMVYAQGGKTSGNGNNNTGNGTLFGADTIPDTTYYQSGNFSAKEKIYSITYYNTNLTVREYHVFYVNGQLSWYGQYDYVNNACTKERYYNPSNQLTFYGVYESNSFGGKDYKYYDNNNTLLWVAQYSSAVSALDSSWQCISVIMYTQNNQIYSHKNCEYTSDEWLSKEVYLNNKNDTTGTGVWGFDPLSTITSYTYTCKNGTSVYNSTTQFTYNKYRYYYHDTIKSPDSLKTYRNDTLLYTARFDYDSRGWLISDSLFDKSNIAIFRGEYTFDKSTNLTTYKYYSEPSTHIYTTTSDFIGLPVSSVYYSSNQVSYKINYSYNDGNYWDTLSKVSSSGSLMSYETYTYYTPYYYVKKYSVYDATSKLTSYYTYDEFGKITDSMTTSLQKNTIAKGQQSVNRAITLIGNSLLVTLDKPCNANLGIIAPNGRFIDRFNFDMHAGNNNINLTNSPMLHAGSGSYYVHGTLGSLPVNQVLHVIK